MLNQGKEMTHSSHKLTKEWIKDLPTRENDIAFSWQLKRKSTSQKTRNWNPWKKPGGTRRVETLQLETNYSNIYIYIYIRQRNKGTLPPIINESQCFQDKGFSSESLGLFIISSYVKLELSEPPLLVWEKGQLQLGNKHPGALNTRIGIIKLQRLK